MASYAILLLVNPLKPIVTCTATEQLTIMYTLRRITTTLHRATAIRTLTTRATTIDTLRAHRKTSPHQPSPSVTFPLESHWEISEHTPWSIDEGSRAFYTTQIYHGQNAPDTLRDHLGPGPATGAGTGVYVSAQMFGTEVKGNPTESEADVAADRSDEDPLPQELHHTIRLGPGDRGPQPTESEEDVCADRGGSGVDPLWAMKRTHRPS
ncbi:hypothetical protein VTI74DRAFT_3039 [Chaetomium olivicolor]